MKSIQINGDLLSFNKWTAIGHCANCQNTMGSGVAAAIRAKYPEAYKADTALHSKIGATGVFGRASHCKVNKDIIFNLYGQFNYGNTVRHVNYERIYTALEAMLNTLIFDYPDCKSIAFPYKMASDRAGGDWNVIRAMIDSVFADTEYSVYIVKLV